MKREEIAKYIDHTLLKAEATYDQIEKLCMEAKKYLFASVCVNPCNVNKCYSLLKDTPVKVCTVIGFPLGATTTKVKEYEAIDAVENGATEVDMVINIGRLKDRDEDYVYNDIKRVVDAVKDRAIVKVIIETALLTEEEKALATKLSNKAGAHFVKTSTGFSSGGATIEDVKLMKEISGEVSEVKASGGVRTYEDAVSMINSGATRLGTSNSLNIIGVDSKINAY
ncbi:MAG: deoxyribose-phosphate aldolase [Clostridium sp.]|uniref:deoxyribose-phosphate aldolase n=1 Tax=Clostridium sp. TaxID=1506 RepID=UPI002FC77499